MIAVNGIHIFRNKSMRSLNCLKKRNLGDETEDCVRQVGTMGVFVTFLRTGCILQRSQSVEKGQLIQVFSLHVYTKIK